MRLIVLLCVLASALGFQSQVRRATSLSAKSTSLSAKSKSVPFLEVSPALAGKDMAGNAEFDPLGFTQNWLDKDWSQQIVPDIWPDSTPRKSITTLQWMRECELKHARVAMLATVGWVAVDSGVRFPGSPFGSIANSLSAHTAAVSNGSMGVLLLLCFVLELAGGAAIFEQAKGSGRETGDFSFDPLGLGKNPIAKKMMAEKEIANGRLAMLAFSGIVTQAALFPNLAFPYF